jgi:hypothetical protein
MVDEIVMLVGVRVGVVWVVGVMGRCNGMGR